MTSKIIQFDEPGAPQVLHLGETPIPQPKAGEILVKVAYAGVNGPDLWQRKGLYPPPKGASPILGLEVSGLVAAVGPGVEQFRLGDEVCALTNGGGYAEHCVVQAQHCLRLPANLSLAEAASLPETYFTVWSNLFSSARLTAGETLLVHGGAGGIGSTAIQMAKAFGVTVIAVDSPADRCAFCLSLGADRAINYKIEDYVEVVKQEYGGADVVLDMVGGPNVASNFKAAKTDGRIIQIAFALGSKLEIDLMPVMLKRLVFTGSTLRSRSDEQKARIASELREHVWPLLANATMRPVIHQIFPLSQASAAHEMMERAEHCGKIVLEVAPKPLTMKQQSRTSGGSG